MNIWTEENEVRGNWRKQHNEELHNLYSSPNKMIKSRRMRWAGNVARMGRRGMHIAYWWVIQKNETIRKTKMEMGWDGMDWIDLAQERDQWRAQFHNWQLLKKD
jgi:hypothetical protein